MADVFISYAHDDHERAKILAETLAARGFSVWWDKDAQRGIQASDDFDIKIEDELEAAACVIVAWSKSSRRSAYVRGEARAAQKFKKLVPITLDASDPPYQFSSFHTEDFSEWQGHIEDDCWQRLVLQCHALKVAAGQSDAVEGAEYDQGATPASSGSFLLSLIVLFSIGAAGLALWAGSSYLQSYHEQFGVMGIAIALAVMAVVLFRQADKDLHPHLKALAQRWLMPEKNKASVSTADAFFRLFEATFGEKHLSWKCVWCSALASTAALPIVLLIFDFATPAYSHSQSILGMLTAERRTEFLAMSAMALSFNVIGDYVSLFETRILLQSTASRPALLLPIVLIDAALTALIFVFVTCSIAIILKQLFATGVTPLWEVFVGAYYVLAYVPFNFPVPEPYTDIYEDTAILFTLYAGLATAYITSIWLWMTALYAPLARAVMWSRTTGLTWFGRIFDTARQPFTALGYLTALFVLATGGLVSGIMQASALVGL